MINKYLIFESKSSLLLIDQHAAAERITYEKLIILIKLGVNLPVAYVDTFNKEEL